MATSEKFRCSSLSYAASDGTEISPTLRNPKKQRQQAAHIIMDSKSLGLRSHTCLIFSRISGVIGNLTL